VILKSSSEVDSVLSFERELSASFPADQKYSFEQRGDANVRTYSRAYAEAFQQKMNNMEERKLREAIVAVGSFWYTAWVNAVNPTLAI
jgi:hypothetical protein